MEFARPAFFALLAAVVAALVFLVRAVAARRRSLDRYASHAVWRAVRVEYAEGRERWRIALVVAALTALVFCLAGPRFGTVFEEVRRRGVDLVVAVDVSKSMMAEDLAPNRLSKATHALSSLLDKMRGDRVAILPFAGQAFVLCPLTLDYGAAKLYLSILDTESIPTPGTNITEAIEKAIEAYETVNRKHKVLLLLTDGENLQGDVLKAAEKASAEGVVIYTIGIGSPEGVPIPERDAEGNLSYIKDKTGQVVLSRLDETSLEKIAKTTGGQYYRSSYGELELDWFLAEIDKMDKKDLRSQVITRKRERYFGFALAALAMLAFEAVLPDRRIRRRKDEDAAEAGDENGSESRAATEETS